MICAEGRKILTRIISVDHLLTRSFWKKNLAALGLLKWFVLYGADKVWLSLLSTHLGNESPRERPSPVQNYTATPQSPSGGNKGVGGSVCQG